MITPKLAQVALSFGADDLDGTVVEEKIYHMAGAHTEQHLTREELERVVRAAGFVVDRTHHQYAGRLDLAATLGYVLQGHGRGGACVDYLANTVHHLEALGLSDSALKRLQKIVESRLSS